MDILNLNQRHLFLFRLVLAACVTIARAQVVGIPIETSVPIVLLDPSTILVAVVVGLWMGGVIFQ